jgi:hypothetical protein
MVHLLDAIEDPINGIVEDEKGRRGRKPMCVDLSCRPIT